MEALFTEKDFTLCNVPVPKGYPQSQTHAGVAIAGNRVYLTTSPFPSIRYGIIRKVVNKILRILTKGIYPPIIGDAQENPMLYWGGINETCPTEFMPYIGNPLASTPPQLFGYHSYNSDPDIFAEGSDIFIMNRECYKKSKNGGYWCRIMQYHFMAVPNGADYVSSKVLLETPSIFLSPSIARWNGAYCLFYLETTSYNTGSKECHLYCRQSNEVSGRYDTIKEIHISSEMFVPWHLSVFEYDGELYAIVACIKAGEPKRLYQTIGKFDRELNTLTINQRPLADVACYRGTAYIDNNGNFVLYNTTVGENIKGGKSVDGREIVMATMDFKELLERLQA